MINSSKEISLKVDKSRMRFNVLAALSVALLLSCNPEENKVAVDENYFSRLAAHRSEKDSMMKFESHSPFNRDTSVSFSPLNYYKPNPLYVFKSKLHRYNPPDTVQILGTKGEVRTVIKEGYVNLEFEGTDFRVNVYKGFGRNGIVYHSIWFTDNTTGDETYGVGRYLDFEMNEDKDFIYDIDFNYAYNPYCSYSALYSCPIPRKEDYLDFSIKAGEKNFH